MAFANTTSLRNAFGYTPNLHAAIAGDITFACLVVALLVETAFKQKRSYMFAVVAGCISTPTVE